MKDLGEEGSKKGVSAALKQMSSLIPATPRCSQGNPAVVGGQLITESRSCLGCRAQQDVTTRRWDEVGKTVSTLASVARSRGCRQHKL